MWSLCATKMAADGIEMEMEPVNDIDAKYQPYARVFDRLALQQTQFTDSESARGPQQQP